MTELVEIKSSTGLTRRTVSRTARVSTARWNRKEAGGKTLARRTETIYKADTRVLRVMQISWKNLQLGELNWANPRRIDNMKALWISLSVTRRGHGAVARDYFE